MISIVSEKTKFTDRPSNVVFQYLNKIYDSKINGSLTNGEFASTIALVGDIFANKVRQGKVTSDEIEQFEAHVSNLQPAYFSFKHEGLKETSKMCLEGIAMAEQATNVRNISARPVLTEVDYNRTFQKLK